MKRKNKYLLLLLLISNICIGQKQLADYVVGKGNLTQVGATATTLDLRISFIDETGVFDGTNINSSCALVFFNTNDNKAYELPIVSVVTNSITSPVIRVNITGFSALNSSVTGQGIIYKKNSANSIIPYVSGITASFQESIQRATVLDIENRISNISVGGIQKDTLVSINYNVTSGINIVNVNCAINNADITITLPTAIAANNVPITIIKTDSNAHRVIINDSTGAYVTGILLQNILLTVLNSESVWQVK